MVEKIGAFGFDFISDLIKEMVDASFVAGFVFGIDVMVETM